MHSGGGCDTQPAKPSAIAAHHMWSPAIRPGDRTSTAREHLAGIMIMLAG